MVKVADDNNGRKRAGDSTVHLIVDFAVNFKILCLDYVLHHAAIGALVGRHTI